jgi:hypothetical protein
MTEQTARRMEKLLIRLLTVLEPKSDKPKVPSAASVTSIREQAGSEDIPSQLTPEQREALEWQRRPRRVSPGRSHVQSFRGE